MGTALRLSQFVHVYLFVRASSLRPRTQSEGKVPPMATNSTQDSSSLVTAKWSPCEWLSLCLHHVTYQTVVVKAVKLLSLA